MLNTKPDPSLDDGSGEKMQKQLDQEIRQMISALTNRLANLQHVHHEHQEEENEQGGMRIITLAGNNIGATMRGEMDEKTTDSGLPLGENEALSTYVNSNFQAINNSIMMGGSYSTDDPGVHMDISNYMEHHMEDLKGDGKKGKKKHKGIFSSKSDQQSEHSE